MSLGNVGCGKPFNGTLCGIVLFYIKDRPVNLCQECKKDKVTAAKIEKRIKPKRKQSRVSTSKNQGVWIMVDAVETRYKTSTEASKAIGWTPYTISFWADTSGGSMDRTHRARRDGKEYKELVQWQRFVPKRGIPVRVISDGIVHDFKKIKEAASFLRVSGSTVKRWANGEPKPPIGISVELIKKPTV